MARLTLDRPRLAETAAGTVARVRTAGRLRRVLACLGAFGITLGLLLRFYAAPALIVAPAGYYGQQVLTAPHATYFDQKTFKTRNNALLTDVNTVRGDAAAATATTVTWDSYSFLRDPRRNETLDSTYERAVFNRRTGEMAGCCGAAVNDDPRIRQYGVSGLFWPIGTAKTTYLLYDTNTDRAWPAVYSGTATVDGVLAYTYVQRVPSTVVQKMPGIPMSLLGVPGASYNVTADRTFSSVNTFWVDPRTGVPVGIEEKVDAELTDPAGLGSRTMVSGDFRLSASSQASLVAMANVTAAEISFLRVSGPAGGAGLGLLLLAAALAPWPARRGPRGTSRVPARAR